MPAARRRPFVLVASLAVAIALVGAAVAIAVANARLLDRRYPVRPLAVAAAPGAGSAVRGRHLPMSKVATDRLHRLDDGEIAAIHAYLVASAATPR